MDAYLIPEIGIGLGVFLVPIALAPVEGSGRNLLYAAFGLILCGLINVGLLASGWIK